MFEGAFRAAGYGEETPGKFTAVGVICADITSDVKFCTTITDDDLAFDHAWRAGNGIVLVPIDKGTDTE